MLDRVIEAYRRGEFADALRLALQVWRKTRAAEVADAIDVISAEALKQTPEPRARKNTEFQKAWISVVEQGDPVALGWAANNLGTRLWDPTRRDDVEPFLRRMWALEGHDDPRLALACTQLLTSRPPIMGYIDTAEAALQYIGAHGDERCRGLLQTWSDGLWGEDGEKIRGITQAFPAPSRLLSEDEAGAWAHAFASPDQAAGLFEDVLANPMADAPRAVLADWLQEQGDPRGEFIMLQLQEEAGNVTKASLKRANSLLKKYKREWVGSLLPVTYRAWFRRGFIHRLELDGSWRATGKGWATHARDPALATVVELDGKMTDDVYAEFVASPALCSLRSVRVWSPAIVEALLSGPKPTVSHLECTSWKRAQQRYSQKFSDHFLPLLDRLPQVDSITCTISALDTLLASCPTNLTHLEVEGTARGVLEHLQEFPAHIEVLKLGLYNGDLELRRTSEGHHCTMIAEGPCKEDVFDLLPKDLANFELVASPKKLDPTTIQDTLAKARPDAVFTTRLPVERSGLATGLTR